MERGKKAASEPSHTQPDTDKQFLERSGASSQIQDVLCNILENRPEEPISFLAEHFEALGDKVDRVGRAAQQVSNTHYSKPAFRNNIKQAYDILSQTKVTVSMDRRVKAARKEPGKQVRGITGSTYMELLLVLCRSFLPSVRDKLLRKIKCRDHEVVPFDVFRSAVFTCLVLKDFLSQAAGLFQSLDSQKTGKVDRVLCESVTRQLGDAINSTGSDPVSVLQAGYTLGPKKLHSAVSTALFRGGHGDKHVMSQEDFVLLMADGFLGKVRSVH